MKDNDWQSTLFKLERQRQRRMINTIWQKVKTGEPAPVEREAEILYGILMDHQEFASYFEDESYLEGEGIGTTEKVNPFLHVAIHQMVEEQVAGENPIEAALLCEYLERIGHTRHEALHLIMTVLVHVILQGLAEGASFDGVKYVRILEKLRRTPPERIITELEDLFS
ncbi:MAG TPA: DUF1841 family protein [Syntrophales bacterium]|nr:DUF1841 family protein [Syntrophales bacterium]HOM06565.1 DUF1841 family protein [Syntrophales bacterium]HON99652.1 DUF1841 family protein [Syntrophales bacterium]HPC00677.1 DUF1841 family protein [Syntrophales bacterium]HPQ06173.1 DUF1841 family protein [Syntrophales bacterium]